MIHATYAACSQRNCAGGKSIPRPVAESASGFGALTSSTAVPLSPSSPSVRASPSAYADRTIASVGVKTPQLEVQESGVTSTEGLGLTPLDMRSADHGNPGSEYPGSPCAPYPLIATPQHRRAMSGLAHAFQELRARGSGSANGSSAGVDSSQPEGGSFLQSSGRLGLPRGLNLQQPYAPMHGTSDHFVADDPNLRAEVLRRKLEDRQGFHFRGDACRLVELGLQDRHSSKEDEPTRDPRMQQPADLAW
jgi:hypothetical protein